MRGSLWWCLHNNTVSNKTVQLQLQPNKHDCDLQKFGRYEPLVLSLHTPVLHVGIGTLVFRIFGRKKYTKG